ncbi:hypothetical protein BRC81_05245 [Halobacteriales archaeon QS_1_68_20]|nr:MAG: hypothetical protein BRC81_05245 [Halobacteriales archaeon QS_1_68_20]
MPEDGDSPSDGSAPPWRAAERTFEEHGLVEYTPPRFADGVGVYEVLVPLEEEFGVDIDFVGYGEAGDDTWYVRVDATPVTTVERERRIGGETVYLLDSDEFRRLVREELA